MFSLCVITASCFQANTSIFCFKKWIRWSLTSLANLDPMYTRCSGCHRVVSVLVLLRA